MNTIPKANSCVVINTNYNKMCITDRPLLQNKIKKTKYEMIQLIEKGIRNSILLHQIAIIYHGEKKME